MHVAFNDALAYAQWAGKELPTEAEWEFAARGGLEDTEFAWGDEFTPDGRHMANTWQGEFPRENTKADGFERTSPVTAFPPNGYGLHDMIGNVWEWTADWYSPKHQADAAKACCIPQNPRGGREADSFDPRTTNVKIPRKVIKGGSHLCAPNYCRRYRPAARHAEPVDTSTSHLGFRCIRRRATDASENDAMPDCIQRANCLRFLVPWEGRKDRTRDCAPLCWARRCWSSLSWSSQSRRRQRSRHRNPISCSSWATTSAWMQPSIYHRGLMVGETPNIDRIGNEGAMFMTYYAEQSCTAGRNAFFTGMHPLRTGMIPPQLPGSPS